MTISFRRWKEDSAVGRPCLRCEDEKLLKKRSATVAEQSDDGRMKVPRRALARPARSTSTSATWLTIRKVCRTRDRVESTVPMPAPRMRLRRWRHELDAIRQSADHEAALYPNGGTGHRNHGGRWATRRMSTSPASTQYTITYSAAAKLRHPTPRSSARGRPI